jgi:DNA topoisomerase-1
MGSEQKSLVIVESPAKAKTINRFLGPSFLVKASMGHVRDLPRSSLGVDIENDFRPHYVVISGKKKTITALRAAAAKAGEIYLAPDMDREGEAIAWHLASLIDKGGNKVRRVIFNEITHKAIKDAFANPTSIDMRKVNAQQARRVLDRLVGYLVSPILWKVIHRRTSAGRVQSVALRLVCEREQEVAEFVPREYWTIDGTFTSPRGDQFVARLEKIAKAKADLSTLEYTRKIEADIKQQTYAVHDVSVKKKRRNPKPPYITSTLQQDAARRLGFSARRTMVIAQELYEGIDLGEKGRAHEAIRPTDILRTPDAVSGFLTRDQARIYKLVWERFTASQMAQAVFEQTAVEVSGGPYLFKVSGSVMKFDGFLKVYSEKQDEKETRLPPLVTGDALTLNAVESKRHETQPPPRYTEASLIKELEEKGIGRPSTYATIISTIQERNYVEKQKTALVPTELGNTVLRILLRVFPDIFDAGFTARMETELDRVESGQDDWVTVIKGFYEPFQESLAHADAVKAELKQAVEELTDIQCDICGRQMVKKWGRHGRFLACSGFPDCKNTRPIEEEVHTDAECPECGGEMIVRVGRYGKFLACKRYPECKGTKPYTLGIKCPEEGCDGELKQKRTKRGRIFYGCEKYPKCKFATWDKPVSESCPECGFPIMVVKTSRDKGSYLKCPKCGSEAKS